MDNKSNQDFTINGFAMSLLIVEDDPTLNEAITTKLNSLNIQNISFEDGRQALAYLEKAVVQNTKLPDAIWLDYYLKNFNGLDFMYALIGSEKLKNIPVVVVSNSASSDKVNKMLALGAKKYILKAEERLDDIIRIIYDIIQNKKL